MAKKAESTLKNMLVSLTVIALVAAMALAALNAVTEKPIKIAQDNKVTNAISAVLPDFDRLDTMTVLGHKCNLAYDGDAFVGAAIETSDANAFGGVLKLMVGYNADGQVYGYKILETHETPGLGAKADQWFQEGGKGQVIGLTPAEELKVKKDGGSVDAISGSTITSRAFLRAVNEGYKVFASIEKQS